MREINFNIVLKGFKKINDIKIVMSTFMIERITKLNLIMKIEKYS